MCVLGCWGGGAGKVEDVCDEVGHGGGFETHAQNPSTPRPAATAAATPERTPFVVGPHILTQLPADGGEGHAPAGPLEQGDPKAAFERGDREAVTRRGPGSRRAAEG